MIHAGNIKTLPKANSFKCAFIDTSDHLSFMFSLATSVQMSVRLQDRRSEGVKAVLLSGGWGSLSHRSAARAANNQDCVGWQQLGPPLGSEGGGGLISPPLM